ncbi:MAG: hypothetical protein R2810_16785 [Flavobacteriales bacterium]
MSWPLRRGIRKQRALRCFFRIRRKLKERSPDYQARWGIAPIFKAGFHYGPVTMGQVGLVKKESIFSGDVVNTAAPEPEQLQRLRSGQLITRSCWT